MKAAKKSKATAVDAQRLDVQKAVEALGGTHQRLYSIIELGQHFDAEPESPGLSGHTLRYSVQALGESIIADLKNGGLLQDVPGTAAYKHCQNADFLLYDLSQILAEMVDGRGSDNWSGDISSAVGRMVYLMGLEAAREIERAEKALTGKITTGFTDPQFSYAGVRHG